MIADRYFSVLLFGGPRDGDTLNVTTLTPWLDFPIPKSHPAFGVPTEPCYKIARYEYRGILPSLQHCYVYRGTT